jgi:hypothetical protein
MLFAFYVISVIHCIWKLSKSWEKNSLGYGLGISPGLDLLMVILLAPLLMIVDIIVTWINKSKN